MVSSYNVTVVVHEVDRGWSEAFKNPGQINSLRFYSLQLLKVSKIHKHHFGMSL